MADRQQQTEWVQRVLGIDTAQAARPGTPVSPIWTDAKEDIDAGISQLQATLNQSGDPDLVQIAKFGLNGATNGQSVKLMAALRDADTAGTPQARAKLVAAADAFRTFLEGDRLVALIEGNPFGVSVPIRKRLGAALDEIRAAAA